MRNNVGLVILLLLSQALAIVSEGQETFEIEVTRTEVGELGLGIDVQHVPLKDGVLRIDHEKGEGVLNITHTGGVETTLLPKFKINGNRSRLQATEYRMVGMGRTYDDGNVYCKQTDIFQDKEPDCFIDLPRDERVYFRFEKEKLLTYKLHMAKLGHADLWGEEHEWLDVGAGSARNLSTERWEVVGSPKKQRFLVIAYPSGSKDNNNKVKLLVYNSDLELQWYKQVSIEHNGQFFVSDNGDVHALCWDVRDDDLTDLKLRSHGASSVEESLINWGVDVQTYGGDMCTHTSENQLIFTGLLGTAEEGAINQLGVMQVDLDDHASMHVTLNTLSPNEVLVYRAAPDGKLEKKRAKSWGKSWNSLIDVKFLYARHLEDGSLMLAGQKRLPGLLRYTNSSSVFEFGDLVFFKVANDGKLLWHKSVPRSMSSSKFTRGRCSFTYTDQGLYFLGMERIEGTELKEGETPVHIGTKVYPDIAVVLTRIDYEGVVRHKVVLPPELFDINAKVTERETFTPLQIGNYEGRLILTTKRYPQKKVYYNVLIVE